MSDDNPDHNRGSGPQQTPDGVQCVGIECGERMLEIHDLTKRYGDVVALDGATFSAAPGRIVGFLGPNGAGKTTTMRAIFGLVRPDRGEILWKGKPVDLGSGLDSAICRRSGVCIRR